QILHLGRDLASPSDDFEDGLRLLDAGEKDRVDLAQLEFRADRLGGPAADETHGPIDSVCSFEAGGEIDRFADHGVVAAILRADAAGDARPAGNADSDSRGSDLRLKDLAAG